MLLKAMEFIGQKVDATDGEIGTIKDIYFDEVSWVIRYFVVEIGPWLEKRQVLLIPSSIRESDSTSGVIKTQLTKQQVKDSPHAETNMPVSRQYEKRLHSYYGWTPYWTLPAGSRQGLYAYIYPMTTAQQEVQDVKRRIDEKKLENADPHLRSVKEVKGYHIKATDGDLGVVEDLLFDKDTIHMTHFVVNTIQWWPSKIVVVDAGVVRNISWHDRQVEVSIDRETVKGAPEYNKHVPIDDGFQIRISAYFRPYSQHTL